jgi:hypothetical protein
MKIRIRIYLRQLKVEIYKYTDETGHFLWSLSLKYGIIKWGWRPF